MSNHVAPAAGGPAPTGPGLVAIPRPLAVAIAARQRQVLRNSAFLAHLRLALARRRQAWREARAHAALLDRCLCDIEEVDRLFPEAAQTMAALDGGGGQSAD